jgi:hypothetical protein
VIRLVVHYALLLDGPYRRVGVCLSFGVMAERVEDVTCPRCLAAIDALFLQVAAAHREVRS